MKILSIIFFSFLLAAPAQGQTLLPVDSKITEVTVFLSGAQVTHEAKAEVKAGNTEIVFKGLSNGLQPKSIQVAAPPDVVIVSAVHAVNYLDEHENQPRVKALQDSLKYINLQLQLLQNERDVLVAEKTMILANQVISGKETALTAEQLKLMADFYWNRLSEINVLWRKNMDQKDVYAQTTSRINQQLAELNYRENQPSNDVVVTVTSFQSKSFTLRLNYFTTQASWTPRYDIRAKDTQSPVQLDYRADVRQLTGSDWKQVMLKLSSANPNINGAKPNLPAWNLYAVSEVTIMSSSRSKNAEVYDKMESVASEDQDELSYADSTSVAFGQNRGLANFTDMVEATTTVEFIIKLGQDIPSDGKAHQVLVQSGDLPAQYKHFAVPKLDKDAFLLARITQWEKLNLLPGQANIFFEGTYVGESYIDPTFTRDTMDISLGRDKKIVISREQIKDKSAARFIGLVREKTFAYEITVRNSKNSSVMITLEDQIPVSQNKEIVVKLEESSGAKLDEASGKLVWELSLAPTETKKIMLIYSVKHPKNMSVPGI